MNSHCILWSKPYFRSAECRYERGFGEKEKRTGWEKKVVLSHKFEGSPGQMQAELEKHLRLVKKELDEVGYWWDSRNVGAMMVKVSACGAEYYKPACAFRPCLGLDDYADYVWRVFLGPRRGKYKLQCFEIRFDWDDGRLESLEKVDWWNSVEK